MKPIGNPFIELPTVESSNNYATGQVQAHMAEHGFTWFAHDQTKGKGQRGKAWATEPGLNIILTTVVEPECLKITDQFLLSAAIANGCIDLFASYAGDETSIKWPNDIYWRDRKAGGILIENILQGTQWKFAIIGIGININQVSFPEDLPNPVSLKQITGKSFDAVQLAKELCEHLQSRWLELEQGDPVKVLKDYNERLYKQNQEVEFKKEGAVFTRKVKWVTASGELVVEDDSENETTIRFGEWEWVIKPVN